MLYLPVGPPGSGKSTLCRLMIESGTLDPLAIVSTDAYREILTGSVSSQHENSVAFSICRRVVGARLRNSLDVWVDATNLKWDWYSSYVEMARLYEASITTILMDIDEEVCRIRNAQRETPVPDEVMENMWAMYKSLDPVKLPGCIVLATDVLRAMEGKLCQ